MRMASTVLLLSLIGGTTVAQTPSGSPTRPRVLGVFDENSGEPVEGVRVTDLLTGTFATTTKTGTVALNFLADSGSLVRLQKIGYQTQTMVVAVTRADTAPITLVLKHVTDLPAVVTRADSAPHYLSVPLRGFEERRNAHAGGYFIGDSALRQREGSTLANVVRTLPGISLRDKGRGTTLLPTLRCLSSGVPGPPQIWVDGVRWSGLFNFDRYPVSSLAGVEFYPDNSDIPAGFQPPPGQCGLLLLWTRER